MKRSCSLVLASVASLICIACSRRPSDPRGALVGQYKLHIGSGSGCLGRGIDSSTLDLRADGSSEQRDTFKDGSTFVTPGMWRLHGDDGISIDKLRITATGEIDKNASPVHTGVGVEWSHPPSIVLNPDDDCLFVKVR